MPPIVTDEGAKAWEVFEVLPEQAVLLLPGDGNLWPSAQSLEEPAVNDGYSEVLGDLVGRTRATVLLTSRPVQQLKDFGLVPKGSMSWADPAGNTSTTVSTPKVARFRESSVCSTGACPKHWSRST